MARITFVFLLGFAGCSASPVVMNEKDFSAHSAIDFENVRFRRPATPIYSLGEADVPRMDPTKDLGHLDCERSEDFFGRLNLTAIRACLAQPASAAFEVEWRLKKDGQPILALQDPEDAPECFRGVLAEIPFPRELVYVVPSDDPARGECFTSRLALETGEILGWSLPKAKVRLKVAFPLREAPKTDLAVERLLRVWALSIYRGGSREKGEFHGRFLPNRYCLKCLGIPESPVPGGRGVPAPLAIWPSPLGPEPVR